MDIEIIKEYITDMLELVKDNLKPYLITLAIFFAIASGITDYDFMDFLALFCIILFAFWQSFFL